MVGNISVTRFHIQEAPSAMAHRRTFSSGIRPASFIASKASASPLSSWSWCQLITGQCGIARNDKAFLRQIGQQSNRFGVRNVQMPPKRTADVNPLNFADISPRSVQNRRHAGVGWGGEFAGRSQRTVLNHKRNGIDNAGSAYSFGMAISDDLTHKGNNGTFSLYSADRPRHRRHAATDTAAIKGGPPGCRGDPKGFSVPESDFRICSKIDDKGVPLSAGHARGNDGGQKIRSDETSDRLSSDSGPIS